MLGSGSFISEYLGTRIHDKAQQRVDNYDRIQGENMERVQESAMHVFGNQLTILATDFLSPPGLTNAVCGSPIST